MNKILKKQLLLEDLDAGELTTITDIVKELDFKKGEQIFKEKEPTKGLYLVRSGKVEISKVTSDGWKQPLAVFNEGHFFGELSILEKTKHRANATAVEDTAIILITKEGFERLEKEYSVVAFKIMKKIALVMSRNLRRMNEKFLNALISY